MIKLNTQYVITKQTQTGSTVTASTTTDTLFVSKVTLDFTVGALYADIQRGTTVNGVFTENYSSVQVTVNPDGSFVSSDGSFTGNLGSAVATLVSSLKSQFDQFVLASGAITGTQE